MSLDEIRSVHRRILQRVESMVIKDLMLKPVMAVELEFYVDGHEGLNEICLEIIDYLQRALDDTNLPVFKVEKERGVNQYEVALKHSDNVAAVADHAFMLKQAVEQSLDNILIRPLFSAKPYDDQPGSGLHVHLSLEDDYGVNQFFREEGDKYSRIMVHSIGGMLAAMKESMLIFAPNEVSCERFVRGSNAPVTISWGGNNRTVAVRLPDSPADDMHIEHRVAGADSDIYLTFAAVLAAAHHGIMNKIDPGPKIFGDAALEMYALESIPRKYDDLVKLFLEGNLLDGYFGGDFKKWYVRELSALSGH